MIATPPGVGEASSASCLLVGRESRSPERLLVDATLTPERDLVDGAT